MKTTLQKLFAGCLIIAVAMIAFSATASVQNLPNSTHSHEVSLDSARKYIKNLEQDAAQMKVKGGIFYRNAFEKLLSHKGVIGIRYYYAKNDNGTPTLVLVGVDSTGKDLTTASIMEQSFPCPPYCDSQSLLQKQP